MIRLLMGGSPCFPEDVMVLTKERYKKISEIEIGEYVLTHKGRWKKVTDIGSKVENTILLKGWLHGLECTKNHPIYTGEDSWKNAEDMLGDFYRTPNFAVRLEIPKTSYTTKKFSTGNKPMPELTQEFAYFIGRWLGDGWIRNEQRRGRSEGQLHGQIFLCDSFDKEEELVKTVKPISEKYCVFKEHSVVKVRFVSIALATWLSENFGKKAINKYIPSWVYGLSKDLRKAMLNGLADSDGHKKKLRVATEAISLTTHSKALALGVRLLAESLGYITYITKHKTKTTRIKGREIKSNVEWVYAVNWANNTTYINQFKKEEIHSAYLVKEIVECGKNVRVYNLSVEEDESYVADSVVVHNCTFWSISQKNNREIEPQGQGWELFKNYLIAKEKYKPDYFLYENNKSMANPIKEQITRELGVEPILINSSLVSAQNRQRYYWTNIPNVPQPDDRGILLRDILESGVVDKEKAYCLKHQAGNARDYFKKHHTQIAFEVFKVGLLDYTPHKNSDIVITDNSMRCQRMDKKHSTIQGTHITLPTGKTQTISTSHVPKVIEPIRIGTIESDAKNQKYDSKQYRVYSPDGKSTTLCGHGGGVGAKTGLYACPAGMALRGQGGASAFEMHGDQKSNAVIVGHQSRLVIENGTIGNKPVYEVKKGFITIKDKQYPIKLADGYYIIRKLTVAECKRLQTVPDNYIMLCSDTQNYKMLGNGWTVDVIAHILSHIPNLGSKAVEVLSMYDGMSCGHIALDKLGADISHYYATEIDKYAIRTTTANYPDTIQLGDAFQVRDSGWCLEKKCS